MLRVKSLDDIKYIDINLDKGRININPNYTNVIYRYKSILFSYDTPSHIPKEFSHLPIPNVADDYAKFSNVVYCFKDRKDGKTVTFPYYLIEVWKEIDAQYRDVFLVHELSEAQHRVLGKQSRWGAHNRAKRKTEDYIKRYLKPEEIKEFQKMLKTLPEKRNKKSNVKIFQIKP